MTHCELVDAVTEYLVDIISPPSASGDINVIGLDRDARLIAQRVLAMAATEAWRRRSADLERQLTPRFIGQEIDPAEWRFESLAEHQKVMVPNGIGRGSVSRPLTVETGL